MASSLKIDGLLGMLTIWLNHDNFLKWSYQLESVLQGYDLFGHFDGSSVAPPKFAIVDEEDATFELIGAYKDWLRTDKALLSLLIASLSDEALEYVIRSQTAREAWLHLCDRYASVSRARINQLKTELHTAQKGGDNIKRFLLRLKHIRDQLCTTDVLISDDDFVIAALNGLPPEYAIIKTVLIAYDSPITLKDFRTQLLAAEQTAEARIVHHSGLYAANSSSSVQPSSVASGQGLLPTPSHPLPHVVPECQICNKRGHTAANCYYRHAPSSDVPSPVVECQICGKRGHAALDCYHRSNYAFQGQAPPSSLTAMTAQCSYSPEQVWITDTGASHHMVGNASHLHNVTSCDVTENVTVGNGEVAYLGQQIKSSLSHYRLGHPTNEVVKLMLQASAVSISANSVSALCSACLHGKMHKLPFPSDHIKSNIVFQRIHSDVWGPSRHKSIDGYRYYVSFVDECTGFLWLYPLFNKSGVFEIFLKFYAFISTQFGAHLQYFQSDGGGEFNSSQFAYFLDSKGVIHQLSCPSTPQQNGFAERKNRHVIETALTLLVTANLPGQFWYHVVAHVAYLLNFMPSIALGNQSPFQKLFGKPPPLQHLRVFGTTVYPYIRPFNEHKLQSRTVQCVFMGYSQGYKGVICYNTITHRFLLSRHVVHDKSIFPFKHSESSFPYVNFSSCPSSSLKAPPIVVFVSHHVPSLASSPYHSLTSSQSSDVPSHVSASFGDDPVLVASSADYTENLQVLSDQQLQAMREEIEALHTQGTWDLVHMPVDKNIVGSRWVYRVKKNSDGSVARHKARLVAQGFSQSPGLDFSETFSPVVRHTTVRLVLSIAAMNRWSLKQLDVKNVFLHGDLEEEVFMRQPQGFEDSTYPTHVCRLRKSLYGLKQVPKAWNANILEGDSLSDPTVYRSIVGALQYLTFTRPDLCYAVNTVYLLLVLWFILETIQFHGNLRSKILFLEVQLRHRALANTTADLAWVRQVLLNLKIFLPQPPTIHCDNLSAFALSSNPVFHSRIKHLDIDFHFVRERVQKKDFIMQYIPTEEQVADIFTKGLHGPIFLRHCRNLQLSSSAGFKGE
ncbi:unnamed protein product [Prunus armeniaca]